MSIALVGIAPAIEDSVTAEAKAATVFVKNFFILSRPFENLYIIDKYGKELFLSLLYTSFSLLSIDF